MAQILPTNSWEELVRVRACRVRAYARALLSMRSWPLSSELVPCNGHGVHTYKAYTIFIVRVQLAKYIQSCLVIERESVCVVCVYRTKGMGLKLLPGDSIILFNAFSNVSYLRLSDMYTYTHTHTHTVCVHTHAYMYVYSVYSPHTTCTHTYIHTYVRASESSRACTCTHAIAR